MANDEKARRKMLSLGATDLCRRSLDALPGLLTQVAARYTSNSSVPQPRETQTIMLRFAARSSSLST